MSIKGSVAKYFYFFVFIACAVNSVFAQTNSSPYSRYGIGDLNITPLARNQAMGGVKFALDQPNFINYMNPASYSNLLFTTYEAGSDFTQYWFNTATTEHRTHTAQVISYFDFAFPIKAKKWAFGFGLEPYSKVGYSITEQSTTDFGDTEVRKYEGSGGLNNFHMGTGFKVGKRLSVGFNAEYLFGTIDNDRTVAYLNPYYNNTSLTSTTSVGWFHFTGGLQYRIDSLRLAKSDSIINLEKQEVQLEEKLSRLINGLDSATGYEVINATRQELAMVKNQIDGVVVRKAKSDWRLVFGVSGSPQADLEAKNTEIAKTFRYYSYSLPSLGIVYKDTIVNHQSKGTIRLPFAIGGGFSLVKSSQWIVSSDISYQQWTNFMFLGVSDSLDNSWRVGVGIQYTPNDRALKAYQKTMSYRVGFHYEKGSIVLNDQTINDIGFSGGLAFPIKKVGTWVHFTGQAGQRGTTQNNLIRERYLKFTLGFTINDRWFVRTKYD